MDSARLIDNKNNIVSMDATQLSYLNEEIRGEVITSGHDRYDSARAVWNGLIDLKPGAIVQCLGVADVLAAVQFARKHHLRIFVRSGGHNVSGAGLADDGYVIDLSAMRSVRVDPHNRTASAEGGARLGDLDHETQAFGLAAPVGLVSATGLAGLTLHGGMGWLLRKHGLSIDNLRSVDVVTADGRLVKADKRQNEDLFWAVRAGNRSIWIGSTTRLGGS